MQQNRLTQRLADYWEMLRRERVMPEFVQLNISTISDLWPNCVLFSILPTADGRAPTLSLNKVGDNIRPIYGNEMLGLTFNTAQRHFQGTKIIQRTGEVIRDKRPVFDEGQFVSEKGTVIKFRSCLMPFGNAEGNVTHVLVGLSWREY